ncbi:MAG: helix-turn-helix domain-containing protein [Tabrizicola sp.]|nr:helix-turn-helix domain-containing protein [Tabrizicola sp.]
MDGVNEGSSHTKRRKGSLDDNNILTRKWGKPTMDEGYTVIPSILLRSQAKLRIKCNELAVLVHLLEHWWKPGSMPWPKKTTIAERLGVSIKTVQRAIVKLEKEKLIQRKERYLRADDSRTSNEYDLSPLVDRLKVLAVELAQLDAEAKTRS